MTSLLTLLLVVAPLVRQLNDSRADMLRTDSVTVFLFGTSGPRRVTISEADGKRTDIWLDRGLLRIGRVHVPQAAYASTGDRDLVIASPAGTHRIRGRAVIAPTDARLIITARLSLADYLSGVMTMESRPNDPIEYLVALAVLQRNYVDRHRGRHAPHADVCDNTHCQRMNLGGVTPRVRHIVRTSLTLQIPFDPCYYSANCGGGTLKPIDVWGVDEPGYSHVRCRYCRGSRWYRWWRTVTASLTTDRLLRHHPAGEFVDEGLKISLGRRVGFGSVPSNTFERIERRGRAWRLYGRGFGHRVGLCQEGAAEMARSGRTARDILTYYFPASQP